MGYEMKKGQVAIWVIVAVVILAAIVLFALLRSTEKPRNPTSETTGPNYASFFEQCVSESVNEVVDIILPRGGFVSPKNYRVFDGTNVEFLCENAGFYEPCINQHPALMKEMKKEIDEYITPQIERCFEEFKRRTEERGAEVTFYSGAPEVEVKLGEDNVFVDVKKKMTIKEKEEVKKIEEMNFEVESSVYNLAKIALEIAAQEADYCYFEYVGYRILYPRYAIKPYAMSEPTIIYQITDTKSMKSMNIAIRSCAMPAGI